MVVVATPIEEPMEIGSVIVEEEVEGEAGDMLRLVVVEVEDMLRLVVVEVAIVVEEAVEVAIAVEVEVEEIVVECNRKEHINCDFSKYFFSVFSVLEK